MSHSTRRPAVTLTHGLRPMAGRDPHDEHRVATTLELLFDLAFVIAFSVASSEFAHLIAEGRYATGLAGFGFAVFAVVWAWINFTWFASAYDTDDWIYRLTTMVQMIGVVILALGLPAMFASLDHGDHLDNRAMVVGYIIMRVPMVSQWLRAARQDPARRRTCNAYVVTIVVSQIGWTSMLLVEVRPWVALALGAPLVLFELAGPFVAERIDGGTPWHPHHIAERYGLLAIIALGEVLLGTVASLAAVIEHAGWTVDVAVLVVGGVGLTFGMWWIYFLVPAGDVLHHRREKSFLWGYGHIFVYAAIAATGAGLHVGALYLEDAAHVSVTAVVLSIAVPVALFFVMLGAMFSNLVGLHLHGHALTVAKLAVLALAVVLASAGASFSVCVLVLASAPVISIVAEETGRGQRMAVALGEQVR
jgi:low temperature requirement protein LtrA